ncbi:MAG: ABC transporter ATP-binding protein, partial [Eubacterium sp.]|nr:ABC transporter ATP-binding protein [Eubacterium sp.]
MSEIIIAADDLCMTYNKKNVALDHLNVDICSGQLIGLIGANGSGKTTFMRLVAGHMKPTGGTVTVMGEDPRKSNQVRRRINLGYKGWKIQGDARLDRYLFLMSENYPEFDNDFAHRLMEYFGIRVDATSNGLSLGEKAVFHFIVSLSTRAELTMLDEPFNGMDIEKRKNAAKILLNDYMEYPRTIIVSSHNLVEIEHIFSDVLLIDNGELVYYGEMDEFRQLVCRVSGPADLIDGFREKVSGEKLLDEE